MAKEICISSTPHETRLAILEDDQLAEIYYERENEYTLAGSIYNGRVTRVLPGMQSAFVDLGLERDAFLYVTDFLEMEDPEESDELEKASVSGAAVAPREVRPGGGGDRNGGRNGQQKGGERQEGRPGRSQERPSREARFTVEPVADTDSGSTASAPAEHREDAEGEPSGPGAKRWRGRRRRRGGRGPGGSPEGASEETTERTSGPEEEVEEANEVRATGGERTPAPAPRIPQTPVPFVLPGESLRKYGGTAETETPKPAAEAPARPASSFKPPSLIETPLVWDGSGLLPGESISRHRGAKNEPVAPAVESELPVAESASSIEAPDEIEEEEFVAEHDSTEAREHGEAAVEPLAKSDFEELTFEETDEAAPHELPAEDIAQEHAESEPGVTSTEGHAETHDGEDGEDDASASHHVDPSTPTGFRLFGLGGKKKTEQPAAPEPVEEPKAATAVATVSSYAPGAGNIEEELIEEEEFDAPHFHAKTDEHDLDDYEEETLPANLRTGDLGELLQEAHLDHKIQLNFEGKTGEDEDGFDEEEDDEEEVTAEGQPAPGQEGSQPRGNRDRGGRGRRGGRPGQGSGTNRRTGGPSRRSAQTSDLPIISDLLKPGQEILVQIAKEPIAKKGARITSHIALPGRFLVFMPTVSHIGVSRKIASDEERQRLKRILVSERGESSGGFIVRTAAEGASEDELRSDLRMLIRLWGDIKQRSESSNSPALIYRDLGLIERILRDQVSADFSSIWVDSEENYERIVRFLNRFSPSLVRRVKLYSKEIPLFEHFGIQDEISKALRSKVWLKSGGSIVINQTEALVAIDINTGKYVGKSARLEDTIVKTNLDAVPEIARQIRLRDLGGIIVIDFIDMDERKNRFKVLAALEEALKSDRAPTKVLQFNDFGLVAITRKRVKQSLERTLSVPCPTCQATGMVKSPTTVCNEIYTELRKMKKHFEGADVLLRVNPETVKVLKQNNASWLVEFEELVGKNILVKSDATLHPEQFDIQG
jgi:ribonuclease G